MSIAANLAAAVRHQQAARASHTANLIDLDGGEA